MHALNLRVYAVVKVLLRLVPGVGIVQRLLGEVIGQPLVVAHAVSLGHVLLSLVLNVKVLIVRALHMQSVLHVRTRPGMRLQGCRAVEKVQKHAELNNLCA